MTGAEVVIRALEQSGTDVVFGYPGASNLPIYDRLRTSRIKHILVRQEQGAAHAANGYARISGKIGVCLATSGPGATNLITGIANAYSDSIPIVAITGQVDSMLVGSDAFQEADIVGATAPFCKHNYLVKKAEDIPRIMSEAFYIAKTGRPGPVLVDIPIDFQLEEIGDPKFGEVKIRGYDPDPEIDESLLRKVAGNLKAAERPIIIAGGGINLAGAQAEFAALVEKAQIPAASTLMGIGALPQSHPLYLGMTGTHGSKEANLAVRRADMIIFAGCRVGNRAFSGPEKLAQNAVVAHFDIDPAEIGKNIRVDYPVVGDIKKILKKLIEYVEAAPEREIKKEEKKFEFKKGFVNPKYFIKTLSDMAKRGAVLVTDVGQNQIWAANNYDGTFLSSGGLGCMGYAIPAAIGAKVAEPGRTVIASCGDGGFQMSMQELGTICQHGIGVKIVLFGNGRLGMVGELQKKAYGGNCFAVDLSGSPDFVKIAGAYGIRAERITENDEVKPAVRRLLESEGPYLLEVRVDEAESSL